MKRWICWSVLLGGITLILTGLNNDSVIPINKNLWSVSFIFATGDMAFLLLSFCYLLIRCVRLLEWSAILLPRNELYFSLRWK
ncbi:heparan-alpha-glucosaminide N-acetyltransferase-like [Montipora capricornis]|uniref:heparan-alpha-glucosaminide N-acetyltransferase-like n=1 Tax=Montipora capricornis TaxID=246305 RepID=UPI0035F120B9